MAADGRTLGERAADRVSAALGSWRFILIQTAVVGAWITLNVLWLTRELAWDRYPFILLNLAFSTQAAYAAPILQLASNRGRREREAIEDQQFRQHRELLQTVHALMLTVHALVETVRADIATRDDDIDEQLEAIQEMLEDR